ncbi:MAG: hypothetical protein H0U63_07880, partial [Burkholderiales bacterium]|nr:hypothetical protein [Burkholderiales bacterium]
ARISLKLLPIFSGQLVIDRVKFDGVTANLKRYQNGTTNFDDLLVKEDDEPRQIKFDIAGASVTNSNIFFADQMSGRNFAVTEVNLTTGKVVSGKPSQFDLKAELKSDALAAQIAVKSGFTLDLEQKHYLLSDFKGEIKGQWRNFSDLVAHLEGDVDLKPNVSQITLQDVKLISTGKRGGQTLEVKLDAPKLAINDKQMSGGKLSGQLALAEGGRTIVVSLAAPAFEGTRQAFTVPDLGVDVTIKQAKFDAKAKLTGTIHGDIDNLLFSSPQLALNLNGKRAATSFKATLTTPFAANMKTEMVELAKINADFSLPNPAGGTLAFNAAGNANIDLAQQRLAAVLNGKLDQSTINARLGLAKFSPPAYTFDVTIDQIDLDRYTKPSTAARSNKAGAPEERIDLSALQDLNASGRLKIGSLKTAGVKASNVRLDVGAGGAR